MNLGERVNQKAFTEWYTEGYISPNTTLELTLNYDYGGFTQILGDEILGDNEAILFRPSEDYSLATHSLGEVSLGGGGSDEDDDESSEVSKFRQISTFVRQDFYEVQPVYSSNEVDQQWEIVAFGPAASGAKAQPIPIKT
jgi:hypothetical protein